MAVLNGGRLLLVQRRIDGRWCCPGWHIEFGKSVADCARREFREETGADVELTGLLGVYSEPGDQLAGSGLKAAVQYLGVIFEGRLEGALGGPSADVAAFGWFSSRDLPADLWRPDVQVIRDALSSAPRPFIR